MKPLVLQHFHRCIDCGGSYVCRCPFIHEENKPFSKCMDCVRQPMGDGEYQASTEEQYGPEVSERDPVWRIA